MSDVRRAWSSLSLLALALATSCGLANGAGLTGHLLYEDEVAICRHCAEDGEACGELADGAWGCRSFAEAEDCAAAGSLFFEHEPEGPYLSAQRGRGALDEGLRSDCEGGRTPYRARVLVFDFEYDTAFTSDWDVAEDDPARADMALLTDVDQTVHQPTSWEGQSYASSDGSDVTYAVDIIWCLSVAITEPVALQVTDKAGHHSNPLCLDAP